MAVRKVDAFGNVVRSYRRALGLTQEELAERAGLSERAIRDMEGGPKHVPRKETVQLLADALGLDGSEREDFQLAARRMHVPDHLVPMQSVDQELVIFPTNLPVDPTPFIGREAEIAQLLALLQRPTVRLVTLTGPGGIGKTRLGLETAGRLRDAFSDGVYVVSLASLTDPNLVPAAIALTLGVEERAGQRLLDTLTAFLQTKRLLLLLDNYEHLLPAAEIVSHLLAGCPQLQILVTSRAVLHLAAEHEYPVPPLTVPDLAHLPDLEALGQYDAIALFLERAQAVKPSFALSQENAAAVVEICYCLDGLPLAIELAAPRLRLFPPQGLLERLSQRLNLLTGGARDRPTRHQTLRGAIDWSYSLLDAAEQRLFARLSAFAGGCSLEAIEAVCNPKGDLVTDVLDGMGSLVEKSLVQQTGEDEPRFVMLQTIQEYAVERLEQAGDIETAQQHTAYFLRLAEEAGGELSGPRRAAWLGRLEHEHDNLRKALRRALETGEVECGLRLAIALGPFWEARGYVSEGRRWFTEILALDGSAAPHLRTAALKTAAWLAYVHRDVRSARELLEQSLDVARELGDQRAMADALRRIGWMESGLADYGRAADSLERGLVLARSVGDKALISSALYYLAWIRVWQGDVATALPLAEESLGLAREMGDPEAIADALCVMIEVLGSRGDVTGTRALLGESLALLRRPDAYLNSEGLDRIRFLGFAARGWGDYDTARALWERAVALSLKARDRGSAARIGVWLALLEREQGRYERARTLLEESLALSQELEDPEGIATALVGLGDVARDRGDAEQTVAFSERALALYRERGDRVMIAFSVHNLAVVAWQHGDYPRAARLLADALALLPRALGTAEVLISTGLVALDQGEYARAEEAFAESLRLIRGGNGVWQTAPNLEGMAGVAVGQGLMDRAARLFGAASALRGRIGTPLMPLHRALYDRHIVATKADLREEQFEVFWEEGRAMTLEQATSYALGDNVDP